ncbi:MAG: YHS domain-containing (seleno)protein [Cyclobacteriaceae bacterium]
MENRHNLLKIIFILFITTSFQFAHGQGRYASEQNTVLFDGYDPVAFFNNETVKGKPSIPTLYQGRLIYFANEENRGRFNENKERFFPKYGGWCAIAMTDGIFIKPDYTMYKIQNGQLMFFRRKAYFNGLTLWDKDPENNEMKANLAYEKYFN